MTELLTLLVAINGGVLWYVIRIERRLSRLEAREELRAELRA